MERKISFFIMLIILNIFISSLPVYAIGDGNIDNGGGGMGQGTSNNFWSSGNEGVRVTVIRASDYAVVTIPIDLTNKTPNDIQAHFGKVSKMSYTSGKRLSDAGERYSYTNPSQALPRIISTKSLGQANIEEIKSYFTDEQVVRSIATMTGMNFETLINGEYRLLIEPIMFVTFQGAKIAMTATEAALYDEQTGGAVRARLPTVGFQNLPLAMFLEVADLGYPAWTGPTNGMRTNSEIKSSLGLGIVRFKEAEPEQPEITTYDYEYRVNTEVITAVEVRGGQSDPDYPVSVTFDVAGRRYTVNNVYYPSGDSQLAWIRWTTPSKPQTITIRVNASGRGNPVKQTIIAKIVDLSGSDPPNPVADDRNDAYAPSKALIPRKTEKTSAQWGIWRPWWHYYWVWHSGGKDESGYWCDHGWWDYDYDRYSASFTATMKLTPDGKSPTATDQTMKSGYGVNIEVNAKATTNQSSSVTGIQNAVSYFPEFYYKDYWRLLDRMKNGYQAKFEFSRNPYSTYSNRTHFSPIWMPDGTYTVYTYVLDCWTPDGMLETNLTGDVRISGNLWTDWHIAPQK